MKFLKKTKNLIKYFIGLAVVILLRLVPHPPNIEPITSTIMPFGKKWGWLAGAVFGGASIIIFDLIHPTPGYPRIGAWTFVTAGMFALIGAASGLYLKNRQSKLKYYVWFSIVATLVYDFITGPIMSSIIWNIGFMESLVGQIPFTINHLIGNIILAIIISPLLYKWVLENPRLETTPVMNRIKSLA